MVNFPYAAGTYADSLFQAIGLNTTLVRYQGTLITPNPTIFHKGTQSLSEVDSPFQDSESLDTYSLQLVKSVMFALFSATTIAQAVRKNAEWQISRENGVS